MEQSVQHTEARRNVRDVMIDTIEYINALPLMRPHWAAFDVAVLLMLFCR